MFSQYRSLQIRSDAVLFPKQSRACNEREQAQKEQRIIMKSLVIRRGSVLFSFFALILLMVLIGCNHAIPRFGIGGRYEEGRDQFFRGKGGDMDRGVEALEYVVSRDPLYKDSLTYLGRAYYRKGRYQDAFAILQRAVAVNKDDEVAWIALGLTQMRLGQTDKGMDSLKGGITLAHKVMVEGYHNHKNWDSRGVVRGALRRSAFLLAKGLEERDNILQTNDRLLALVDDEENFQKNALLQNNRQIYN
jgi:tetratricopeptide (TPR) repeat protein